MKIRSIVLFALCFSLIGCGLGNQNISTIVEIENGSIKGVQQGNLKKYLGIFFEGNYRGTRVSENTPTQTPKDFFNGS